MRVSVIPSDRVIIIDDQPIVFDFQSLPGLRAIQWNGVSGTLEFNTGPQQWFDNPALIQPYIDAYNAEKARIDAAQGGA